MSTVTKVRERRQLPPVSGTVRVLRPIGAVNDMAGEILINGKAYYVELTEAAYRLHGYDAKKNQTTSYDLTADLSACDCPDAAYRTRDGGCKHARALAALRAAGKLPELRPADDCKPGHSSGIPF